jgi:hypothetical protein
MVMARRRTSLTSLAHRIALQAVVNHSISHPIVSDVCPQHSTCRDVSVSLRTTVVHTHITSTYIAICHLIACGRAMKCASAASLHRAVDGGVLVYSNGEVQSSDQNATLTGVRKLLEPATTFVVPFVHCRARVHHEAMTPKFNHSCAVDM